MRTASYSVEDFYNLEIKNQFLSKLVNEPTKKPYERVFKYSAVAESLYEKDLYDFSRDEIANILSDLNPTTPGIAKSNGRMISSYISWAIAKGFKKVNNNPLQTVDDEWLAKFVDTDKKIYFSKDEIEMVEDNCKNAQDAVVLRLLFENVQGKELAEIRNLKMSDVNKELRILTLTNLDGKDRKVEVSERCIKFIEWAYIQDVYFKKNGTTGKHGKYTGRAPKLSLVESEYVVKSAQTNREEGDDRRVEATALYRRLDSIGDIFGYEYLTSKNIFRSGIIYRAYKLWKEEKQEVNLAMCKKLAAEFGIKNPYEMKEYVNMDIINSLYE